MGNELIKFDNAEFGSVRVMLIDGDPWFVGKDVANALGYKNERKALRDHVPDRFKLTERIVTVEVAILQQLNALNQLLGGQVKLLGKVSS